MYYIDRHTAIPLDQISRAFGCIFHEVHVIGDVIVQKPCVDLLRPS